VWHRSESGQRVAISDAQRRSVDGDDLFEGCANPNCGTVSGEIGAARAGYRDLGDRRLAGGGKNIDTIHGAIGYEKMLVGEVVGDMAMMRLTKRIVGSGNRSEEHTSELQSR